MEPWEFFDIMRGIIIWTAPAALVMGLALLAVSNFNKIEKIAGKEYGMCKKIFPKIETNIFTFHEWCLDRRIILGLICIIYAIVVFALLHRSGGSLGDVIGEVY